MASRLVRDASGRPRAAVVTAPQPATPTGTRFVVLGDTIAVSAGQPGAIYFLAAAARTGHPNPVTAPRRSACRDPLPIDA